MSWWGIVASVVISAVTSTVSAYGRYKQGIATRKYYNYLAQQNDEEARHVKKMGDKQSELIQDTAMLEGKRQKAQATSEAAAQKVAMVANGLDLSSVSASDITSDTISKAKLDEIAIRYNADIKSWQVNTETSYKNWALQTKATQHRFAGEQAYEAGRSGFRRTLITSAALIGGAVGGLAAYGSGAGKK